MHIQGEVKECEGKSKCERGVGVGDSASGGVTRSAGGRGGLQLKKQLRLFDYKGLVTCTFWPPLDAAERLVGEVIEMSRMIRGENMREDWGMPHLEAMIFNWRERIRDTR